MIIRLAADHHDRDALLTKLLSGEVRVGNEMKKETTLSGPALRLSPRPSLLI